MDSTKLKEIKQDQADKALEATKHQEGLAHADNIAQTVLSATSSLIKYLEGHTSKTEVVNQLESISTPDVKFVVKALEVLDRTIKDAPQTDLSGVTQLMQELVTEAKAIPKQHADPQTFPQPVDNTKQLSALLDAVRAVEKVVKAQKLIAEAPIVNVPETNIQVDPPNLEPLQNGFRDVVKAVKAIVIPEYTTDNKAVEKLIKDSNKLLKSILEKPVGGGGGGGSSWVATGSNGIPVPLNLDGSGNLKTTAVFSGTVDSAPSFAQNPTDPTPTPAYGKVDSSGNVLVSVVAGEAPVTNDGTFAKETGGNLATIAAKDFATQTTLALIKAKTDNFDVALSTRTKPADQQHVIVDSGVTTGLTDTQLRATPVPVSGTVTATTGGLTDTQLRATPVPVSNASLPLPSGASTAANQLIGLMPKVFDALTYTATSGTVDTYLYYTGGTGGSLVATLTVTFTASDHLTLVSVVRT